MMNHNRLLSALAACLALTATQASAETWSFDRPDCLAEHAEFGTLKGTGVWKKQGGITGGAWFFNGKTDALQFLFNDRHIPEGELTVAFWIRPLPGSQVWQLFRHPHRNISFAGGPDFGWFEAYNEKNRQFYNGYAHPQTLKPNQWYHFALVYDSTGIGIFLDGKPIGRADSKEGTGNLRHTPGVPFQIGGRLWNKHDGFFHGYLDDLEISTVARHDFSHVIRQKKQLFLRQLPVPEDLNRSRRQAMVRTFGTQAAQLTFAVAVESALTRILPDDLRVGTIRPKATLETAANEREHLQLLVLPYKPDLDITITLPQTLQDQQGNSFPFDLRSYRVDYTPMPRPSPYMYTLNCYPDRLIATHDFKVTDRKLAPIWLEVNTPGNTPAGIYRGAIDINGFQLPLSVRVWNFQLPRRNIVPTLINIWERDIQTFLKEGDVEGFIRRYVAYGDMLLEHRLNPVVLAHAGLVAPWVRKAIYPDYRIEDGKVVANTTYLDVIVSHFRQKGLSIIPVGPHYNFDETKLKGGDWWTNISRTQPEKIWNFVQEHARKQGWLGDAVAYPIDEPENNVTFVNRVSSMLHRAAPEIPLLLTSGGANYPDRSLKDIGIWVPILHWTNQPEMKRQQQLGKPVWTYVCTGPNYPFSNLHGDTPGMAIRFTLTGAARFGYDGFLHWAANFNTYRNAPIQPNSFGAGEGAYLQTDDHGFPIPTVRLKHMGDGMEDWTYLMLLKHKNSQDYRKIMGKLECLLPEKKHRTDQAITLKSPKEASFHTFLDMGAFYHVYDHPDQWLDIRREMAEMLSR